MVRVDATHALLVELLPGTRQQTLMGVVGLLVSHMSAILDEESQVEPFDLLLPADLDLLEYRIGSRAEMGILWIEERVNGRPSVCSAITNRHCY